MFLFTEFLGGSQEIMEEEMLPLSAVEEHSPGMLQLTGPDILWMDKTRNELRSSATKVFVFYFK